MSTSTLIIAVTALFNLVTAQNYSTSGPFSIIPGQLPLSLRQTWCNAQLTSCPIICGVYPTANRCSPETLAYTCTCSDGSKPNISDYQETIPYYVCEQWITNCVASNPDDLDEITDCRSVTCGDKNVSELAGAGAAPSGSASASASSGVSGGGSGGSASSTSSEGMAAATRLAQNYGTQILAGGMLAAFGLAL